MADFAILDYRYAVRSSKSPDRSYKPRNITIPPAKPQTNLPTHPAYPTLMFEIAHRNETYARLKHDARRKTFSARTSIQVVVGIKLYRRHFQVFWGRRATVGRGMKIVKQTPKLFINRMTRRVFNIPANLIFWGVPTPPPLPSQYLSLSLEILRQEIAPYMM